MQPRPMAETVRPSLPSFRVCIRVSKEEAPPAPMMGSRRGGVYSSVAFRVMGVAARALETGQPSLAAWRLL